MRRTWLAAATFAFLLPLIGASSFAADTGNTNKHAQAAAKSAPVPLLWKVSDKDNSVYLLGSFHMLRADDYPLSKDVDAAYADAEEVVFEMPPEEIMSAELGTQMALAALRTDGSTLNDDLTPELAKQLSAWTDRNATALATNGMSPEMFQKLEPWFVGLAVTIVEAQGAGFESELGLDNHFGKRAKNDGKRTAGMETGAQQLAMLDGMSREEQLEMLAESLDPEDGGRQGLGKLHDMWRRGDAKLLWTNMGADFLAEYPALYKRINVERNDAWVPKIVSRLDAPGTDDTLVVVGTLHLLGKDGVVEKLKAKGYKVERICSACKP
jgi:uncharacterized protein YbaP (TraB family)